MKRGVPVIAARSASLPEVLGEAALYHEVGAAEEIAVQVRRVLGDSELRSTLIEAGREMSARYTWDRAATAMAGLLARAAASGTSQRDGW
jgi:glycosyltransferase involved in cell wall biosynthesis